MAPFHNDDMKELYRAIVSLGSEEECGNFFEDLCTIKELQDMAQRYAVARMLDAGVNYKNISEATGVSTATISRVNKCLEYGSGGYRLALGRAKDAAAAQLSGKEAGNE